MRRHECGIGCGARGQGMNAPPPKLPGGAGTRANKFTQFAQMQTALPGTLRSPARSSLTAGRQACPRLCDNAAQKGPAANEPEARRNGASESAARRRNDVATERRTALRPLA